MMRLFLRGLRAAVGEVVISEFAAGGMAIFEPDPDVRILPSVISGEFTATGGTPPWQALGDVWVEQTGRLLLEPGTTLLMPDGASLRVSGEWRPEERQRNRL